MLPDFFICVLMIQSFTMMLKKNEVICFWLVIFYLEHDFLAGANLFWTEIMVREEIRQNWQTILTTYFINIRTTPSSYNIPCAKVKKTELAVTLCVL